MSFRRLRPDHRAGLLFLVALGFASPTFAQDASRDSSDHHEGFCRSAACRWSAVSAGVLLGTLSVAPANRTERMVVSMPHAATTSAQITPEACAACKLNDRPFDVPPGILEKLMAQLGLGRGPNAHSKNGAGAQGAGGSEVGGGNGGSTGPSMASDNSDGASGGAAGGSGGANGAGNSFGAAAAGGGPGVSAALASPGVTVTPEPQTAVLVATGLIALVPVSRIRRRR